MLEAASLKSPMTKLATLRQAEEDGEDKDKKGEEDVDRGDEESLLQPMQNKKETEWRWVT